MTINEWLQANANYITLDDGTPYKVNYDRLVCVDGYTMSVQARNGSYCMPRTDDGPWTHVEIGYPDNKAKLLMPYREGRAGGVYPLVPVEVVDALIAQHGGIAAKEESV